MINLNQRTLQAPATFSGVGLHCGATVTVHVRPAPVNHGISFVRTDLGRPVTVPALAEYVVDTSLATTLGRDGVRIGTVEHLLAAVWGLGIDNARIELDGPEVPIMDGSAAPFVEGLFEAGVREQDEAKSFLLVRRPVTVLDGDKEATLSPSRSFRIDCTIDFRHPLITGQRLEVDPAHGFSRELARARTFGFLKDVERLKQVGLGKGGSLANAIVVDEFSILNPEGLRFPDEFVRHKALDALGDMALFGRPVLGALKVVKGGHALHHRLVQKVLADSANFEIVRARTREERIELGVPELTGALEPLVA